MLGLVFVQFLLVVHTSASPKWLFTCGRKLLIHSFIQFESARVCCVSYILCLHVNYNSACLLQYIVLCYNPVLDIVLLLLLLLLLQWVCDRKSFLCIVIADLFWIFCEKHNSAIMNCSHVCTVTVSSSSSSNVFHSMCHICKFCVIVWSFFSPEN